MKTLTVNEVEEANPNFLNPLKVKTRSGFEKMLHPHYYILSAPDNDRMYVSDSKGNIWRDHVSFLDYFPSLKPEEPKFKEVVRYVPVFYEGDLGYSESFETIDECMEQEMSYSKLPAIGYKPVTVYLKETDNE